MDILRVTIKDQGTMNGLMNMKAGIKSEAERILDKIADNVRAKMEQEAPEGESGRLKGEIAILTETNKRIIEPMAKNLSGSKYGQYVEAGTGPRGGNARYMPNVENLMNYYATTKGGAWAMAKRIQEVGTKANPFVQRTFQWLQTRISTFAGELAGNITAYYGSFR